MNVFLDWRGPIGPILKEHNVKEIIEFGLGAGTGFLLEEGREVLSVEFLAQPSQVNWVNKTLSEHYDNENWELWVIPCKDFTTGIDEKVEKRLIAGFQDTDVDFIFVDPGVHYRGDIVNLAFGHAPIIAAHDTNHGHGVYGWDRIEVPENYEEIKFEGGQGTTVWIEK